MQATGDEWGPNHVVLEAAGPSKNGNRTVIAVYFNGRVMVPFGSYAGMNSGIAIDALTTREFRSRAAALFGFTGSETVARTSRRWLRPERADALLLFCLDVANAYAAAP